MGSISRASVRRHVDQTRPPVAGRCVSARTRTCRGTGPGFPTPPAGTPRRTDEGLLLPATRFHKENHVNEIYGEKSLHSAVHLDAVTSAFNSEHQRNNQSKICAVHVLYLSVLFHTVTFRVKGHSHYYC